jgi:tetratricopeptide (TPR) repeat protein
LGLSLHQAARSAEAIAVLKSAVETDPESIDLHYQLGLLFADRRQFAQALEQFEYALDKSPDNIDLHANLALALQNMGLLDRAQASWQILCELTTPSPSDRETLSQK